MIVILWIAGSLVALVIVMNVIGALLPRDHVATRRARIAQSPDILWTDLTSVEAFPTWRKDVTRVETLPPREGRTAWREISRHGTIPFEIEVAEAPRKLVTRIADPSLPFGGTWTFELTADGGGTIVAITEAGEVKPPIFRFLSRFVFGHTSGIDAYLRALSAKHGGA
jgi:hypothetical protein